MKRAPFLCMHLGTAQTAGNRSIDVYTDPKKDPRSKYCFIFENELEIVEEADFFVRFNTWFDQIMTKR